jgi:hypothetical protein
MAIRGSCRNFRQRLDNLDKASIGGSTNKNAALCWENRKAAKDDESILSYLLIAPV